MYTYKLHLHKETEGGFTVTVPALPGCITYGEDVDEAISMAKEAIELYIEELQERGEDVPDDSNILEYSIHLQTVWTQAQSTLSKYWNSTVLFSNAPKVCIKLYYNPTTNKTVIVPVQGGKDMKKGTFLAILKQAGIDKNDLD